MSNFPKPFLYLKAGCPWCEEATAYLQKHEIEYDSVVVTGNPAAMTEMKELSGQTKAPTMKWGDEVLADFGAAELDVFLIQKGFFKDVREEVKVEKKDEASSETSAVPPAETAAEAKPQDKDATETVVEAGHESKESALELKKEEPIVEVKKDDAQVPKN